MTLRQAAGGNSCTEPASPSPPSCYVDPPRPLCQDGLALLHLKPPPIHCRRATKYQRIISAHVGVLPVPPSWPRPVRALSRPCLCCKLPRLTLVASPAPPGHERPCQLRLPQQPTRSGSPLHEATPANLRSSSAAAAAICFY